MIGSAEVNKVIRRVLSPVLRQHGFAVVQTRKNYGFHGPVTWVLQIRSVGSYFSDVTGWPPMSLCVWLGAFYEFCPRRLARPPKTTPDGRLLPQEYECQQRGHLSCSVEQYRYTDALRNPAEQWRTDIWWIERDGSNIEEAVHDIAHQFVADGLPWFESRSDVETTYAAICQELECYATFQQAACFAKHLGRISDYERYRELLRLEATRKGMHHWEADCP